MTALCSQLEFTLDGPLVVGKITGDTLLIMVIMWQFAYHLFLKIKRIRGYTKLFLHVCGRREASDSINRLTLSPSLPVTMGWETLSTCEAAVCMQGRMGGEGRELIWVLYRVKEKTLELQSSHWHFVLLKINSLSFGGEIQI